MLDVFASVFLMVFLAELADKTQLVTFALVAKTGKPGQVYLGVLGGLLCVTALGAIAGAVIAYFIPLPFIRLISGVAFVVIGCYVIIAAWAEEKEEQEDSSLEGKYVWARAFLLLFLAELGDKTQLVVILTAATTGVLWAVFIAGFAALALVNGIGVLIGDRARHFFGTKTTAYIAGAAFIITGALVLLGII
ncbi:MAG: TMEM165/GDT1 family protein [Promethearchaeota archaeon]